MAAPILYVHTDPLLAAAQRSVYAGLQLTVTRDDWPAVRAMLVEQSDEFDFVSAPHVARCCRSEIQRIDAGFADPDCAVVRGGGVILTVGVA